MKNDMKVSKLTRATCLVTAVTLALSGCATPAGGGGSQNASGSGTHTAGQSNTGPMADLKNAFVSDDPCANTARNIGAVAGGLVGALLVRKLPVGSKAIGIALGAGVGAFIGIDIDNRRCEMSKIAKNNNVESIINPITLSDGKGGSQSVGMTAAFVDAEQNAQFAPNSDKLTPSALKLFTEVSTQYNQNKRISHAINPDDIDAIKRVQLLVIGHTDDTEDSRISANLSERRARQVAKVLLQGGVPNSQIFFQGAGETLPIADNRTPEGRAKNRSVEVIEFANDAVMREYLDSRAPITAFYRSTAVDQQAATSSGASSGTPLATSAPSSTGTSADIRSAPAPVDVSKSSVQVSKSSDQPSSSSAVASKESASVPASTSGKVASAATAGHAQSTPGKALAKPVANKPAAASADTVDFGGSAVGQMAPTLNIGEQAHTGIFSIIPTAHAADDVIAQSCLLDRPRIANSVKSLGSEQNIEVREFLPGLYGKTWTDIVNKNLIAISHVSVLKDGAQSITNPTVVIYKDFDIATGRNRKPNFTAVSQVNVYKGTEGVLYRVFPPKDSPIKCMDLVLPGAPPVNKAKQGFLYYSTAGNTKFATTLPGFE